MNFVYVGVLAVLVQMALNLLSQKIKYGYRIPYQIVGVLLNVLVWELCFHRLGWSISFGLLSLASSFLIASSIIDRNYKEIPDSYNLAVALLGCGFMAHYHHYYQTLLLGGIIVFLLFLAIAYFTGMGGGDVKMAGAIGLFLGVMWLPKFIIFTFFTGAIEAIILLMLGKKKQEVLAFGPYIALSGIYLFLFCV